MNAHCIDFESSPYQRRGIVTANDLQKTRYSLYPGHTDIFLITGGGGSHFQKATEKSQKNFSKFYVKPILPKSYWFFLSLLPCLLFLGIEVGMFRA